MQTIFDNFVLTVLDFYFLEIIMNEFSNINFEFENVSKIHKKRVCCHSIDKKRYKILCENFFANIDCKSMEIMLAQESLTYDNESENKFVDWLNKE